MSEWRRATPYERLTVGQTVKVRGGMLAEVIDVRPYKGEAFVRVWEDDRTYGQQWMLYDELYVAQPDS